ncbi:MULTISPECIES: O-antigen ligase family protein [unclassified Luteimonas]|uniref:O-antigen ligase family protein n=1 Tax=unclassified Luteimonas TaxID=2629088 RepID=UPI0018F0B356|nr:MULTISPECIES: O-antigen ligase family protein [unclassified Luteimonas]MBJ6978847.1 O-antigen ligase family protein [Luteimonas sp. MC1895]MBJ6984888.1 O-antigen ligase family protein [Luteimonas sp. MC1750]QQO05572.1 O-antigen ligase family protein [Luteimonas sp. MC1750]
MTNSADAAIPPHRSAATGWRWAPHWVLAFVALWPAPGYAEGIVVLGALAAIIKLAASRFRGGAQLLSGPAWALTSVLFFAYWLPELLSTVGSVDAGRALREAAVDLRYLPFLWLVAIAVADDRGRRLTFTGLAVIVAIWTLDALVEVAFDTSPLFWGIDAAKQAISGRPMCNLDELAEADRLGGVLGPCNLKLGVVLASLSPFALYAAGRRWSTLGWVVAAAAIGVAIVFAGSRASWLTYALVLLLSGWRLLGWKRLLGVFAGGVLVTLAIAITSPEVRDRFERTTQAFQASSTGVDAALSGRTRIWGAALCMVREHPLNGVGARGFREAFPACDPEAGAPAAWGAGPALHAHQIVLEVLSETGIVGLLLWLSGVALALRAWRFASAAARERARPAMLALLVTVFPLNTHLAFYSTFWGALTLMLAALYAGSLLARAGQAPPDPDAATPAPAQ